MTSENHYADLVIQYCDQMLNFLYYYYPVGILDKQLMNFIDNARIVVGLAKWIFTAFFIAGIVFFRELFGNKYQSIFPNP